MKEKNRHTKNNSNALFRIFRKLFFTAVFGFVFTLAILVVSNIMEYNLISQYTDSGLISLPYKYITVFFERFVHSKDLILAGIGSALMLGFRALFLFEKTSIL